MVRFKNRYIVFELTWKDGRLDEGLSELNGATWANYFSYFRRHDVTAAIKDAEIVVIKIPRYLEAFNIIFLGFVWTPSAGEAGLLTVFRENLQQTFGDYGLGSALASFQGMLSSF